MSQNRAHADHVNDGTNSTAGGAPTPREVHYSPPQGRYSPSRPGSPQAGPTILSDSDVDRWLARHHPEVLRELNREASIIEEAKRRLEDKGGFISYVGAAAGGEHGGRPGDPGVGPFSARGLPRAALGDRGATIGEVCLPERHWVYRLFPHAGGQEILEGLSGTLEDEDWEVLHRNVCRGEALAEIARAKKRPDAWARKRMAAIRQTVYNLARVGLLPDSIAGDVPGFEDVPRTAAPDPDCLADADLTGEALFAMSLPAVALPPGAAASRGAARRPRRAMVCDCGRHLNLHDHLSHDPAKNVRVGKERHLTCDHCMRRHPESTWAGLVC